VTGAALADVLARRQLPALDGCRAVAVLAVLVFHFDQTLLPGDLGVAFFFVLSGFLITWLLRREWAETGRVSLRGFYARRVLRIFPAYYVFVGVAATIAYLAGNGWPPILGAAMLTYNMDYLQATGAAVGRLGHMWSLAIEEKFYLLWPACFLLLAPRGWHAVRLGLVVTIVVALVWRSAFVLAGGSWDWTYHAFDTRIDNIAIGCLLALVVEAPAFLRVVRAATARVWLPLVTVALIVASRWDAFGLWHNTAGYTVEALLMALLIAQLLVLHERPFWRWLDHPIARWLGRLSYSLYLYHILGLSVRHLFGPLPAWAGLAVGTAAAIAFAAISHYAVERPFLRLKDRWARTPAPEAVQGR
jgi:peptidoglycan/LPS O-acetylase OafA/YrhL